MVILWSNSICVLCISAFSPECAIAENYTARRFRPHWWLQGVLGNKAGVLTLNVMVDERSVCIYCGSDEWGVTWQVSGGRFFNALHVYLAKRRQLLTMWLQDSLVCGLRGIGRQEMCGKEGWIFQFGLLYKKNPGSTSATDLVIVLLFFNNNNIIIHKRMLPNNALHNADFLTCNTFR